ncbi:MAG: YceI family protein [Prevotella sp.]|jgi:polyisoprenoid-binding protein YceI
MDKTSMSPATNRKWVNDKEHTRIAFEIRHAGLSWITGNFTDFEIKVSGDEYDVEAVKADVKIKMASVNTGVPARDKHLQTADFFDVEKFPYMTFETTRVKSDDETHGALQGNLTLHGVTCPVTLSVELIGKHTSPFSQNYTAGFRLCGVIKCTDFGIGPKYIPKSIGNEVNITVDGEFALEQEE